MTWRASVTRFRTLVDPCCGWSRGSPKVSLGATPQVEAVGVDPAVATSARENRMLSPGEIIELVEAYRRGATERSLARRFGAHRHTISRHLQRAGVVKRPKVKMTKVWLARARELRAQGWSMERIGRELGVGGSTVRKALKCT